MKWKDQLFSLNKLIMKNKEEYEKFVAVFAQQIDKYILSLGYFNQGYNLYEDSLKLRHIEICYLNTTIQRRVNVNYSNFKYKDFHDASIVVSLGKLNKLYPIQNILENEKITFKQNSFSLLSYEGEFEEQIILFCEYLIGVFNIPELQEWLLGKKWVDIPFDWSPYK